MGLDQYLSKRTFVGAQYQHRGVSGKVEIKSRDKALPIKFERISYVEEQVGYWRKANQIHRWFVENVQGGQDDCGEYPVSIDQLKSLLDDCMKIKECVVNAPELLPTQAGFFFGSTDYDEYYWQDIDDTIETIEGILKEQEEGAFCEYRYSSSW